MNKASFFYNYTADKGNYYNKFAYGVMTIECSDDKDIATEAFNEIQKESKKNYPDADNINFTAFNRV